MLMRWIGFFFVMCAAAAHAADKPEAHPGSAVITSAMDGDHVLLVWPGVDLRCTDPGQSLVVRVSPQTRTAMLICR